VTTAVRSGDAGAAGADWHAVPIASAAPREGYLVIEREGRLWGVAGTSVRRLTRSGEAASHGAGGAQPGQGGSLRLTVAGGDLTAHRVLAMVPDLEVTPTPGSLLRFWPEAADGLAVYEGRPLVVIDPQRPPSVLLRGEDEED